LVWMVHCGSLSISSESTGKKECRSSSSLSNSLKLFKSCMSFNSHLYGRYSVQKVFSTRSELARKKSATSALNNSFNLDVQLRRTATWPYASSEIFSSRNPSSSNCTGRTVAECKLGFEMSKFWGRSPLGSLPSIGITEQSRQFIRHNYSPAIHPTGGLLY
jgi:hypothetical protein